MTDTLTLGERLTATRNRPAGFDYIRIVLAFSVIGWHSLLITYGTDNTDSVWGIALKSVALLIVPMFFALSGFLVAGSLERSKSLVTFLGLRIFRIMPALAAEVLVSALILGPVLTTWTLSRYVSSPVFHEYFWNILGDIHYHLPGVFEYNPTVLVNGQLWTVPYELVCYVLLTILTIVGIVRRRAFMLGFLGIYYVAQVGNTLFRASTGFEGAGGSSVVMAFITGVVFYRYRDRIPWSRMLFLAAVLLSIALPLFFLKGMRFAAIPVTYMTVYIGLLNPTRNRVILSGDYSYGLYLYGFPIQQAVYTYSPLFHTWYYNILLAFPLTTGVAICSWWLLERPVMNRRGVLRVAENWYLHRFPSGLGRLTIKT